MPDDTPKKACACPFARDPQENDPKLGEIIRQAGDEAQRRLFGDNRPKRGDCHQIWTLQQELLREQGINWKSPAEMNPNAVFD